jgi:hypothetical protein
MNKSRNEFFKHIVPFSGRKLVLSLAFYTFGASAAATAGILPEGKFHGEGLWKSSKEKGTYEVSIAIEGNTVSSAYQLPDGSIKKWSFTMADTANGLFKVTSQGVEIGEGYCLDQAQVCHYTVSVGPLTLEETVTYMDQTLYRFGSKDEGRGLIAWQEKLNVSIEHKD